MTPSRVEPHLFVVLGGRGDLMQRELLPALHELRSHRDVGGQVVLLGVSRREWNDEQYRAWAREAIEKSGSGAEDSDRWCDGSVYYQSSPDDVESYRRLAGRIAEIEKKHNLPGNRVFYLAIPPASFGSVIHNLGEAGLNRSKGWTRLVVEKPFGEDLESARKLNGIVRDHYDESQIYRIDHFLAKEMVQNLVIFRFANMLFESAWSRNHIANVQITVAEDIGVGTRAGYYDHAGALRDMIQNHLTQLLTLIAMDAPSRFDADAMRDEKLRVLRSINSIPRENVVFARYTEGKVGGERVRGYLEEKGIPAGSRTETFVAMKLFIDNWRWQGVPFYLRTGKRMHEKVTEISIVFREPPVQLFRPLGANSLEADILRIRMQPDQRFRLSFSVKVPGEPLRLEQHELEFGYADVFHDVPTAYHTLLLDIMAGDQTHFVRADEVEASWRLYTPLLRERPEPCTYAAGSWGPAEAAALLEKDGARWLIS